MVEAGAEPEAGQVMLGQPGDELALLLRRVELDAGGEDELASRQPRGWVDQLGDVHPADGGLGCLLACQQLQVDVLDEPLDCEHVVPPSA